MCSNKDQIRDLLHRYATAIDTKNWALLQECFAPESDGVYQGHVFSSREHLVRAMRKLHNPLDASLHRITNIATEIRGHQASGTAYVDALLVETGHPNGPLHRVAGCYTDRYINIGARWAIQHRRFEAYWVWEREQSTMPNDESQATLVRVDAMPAMDITY